MWLPLLHRMASVENVFHPVQCDGCGKDSFSGMMLITGLHRTEPTHICLTGLRWRGESTVGPMLVTLGDRLPRRCPMGRRRGSTSVGPTVDSYGPPSHESSQSYIHGPLSPYTIVMYFYKCHVRLGFRYKCQRCHNYLLCQDCFWRGRVSGSHTNQHEMKEYSNYVRRLVFSQE